MTRYAMAGEPAEVVGCCRKTKEACTRPPCPCNLDAYTAEEMWNLQLKPGDGLVRMATDGERRIWPKA